MVIRGGRIVTPAGIRTADIHVSGGVIEDIGPELPGADIEIDARGLVVFPGIIDVHLHFNEPGRTEWEGAATGSRALAAGGGTLFCDMPLNSTPCTLNAREFARKRAALEAVSITDFALWGGLIPGSVGQMEEMAALGAVGFKAFLCDSGLPEFPRTDDLTLYQGLKEAARLSLPVAVHAENQEIVSGMPSRPVVAELEAIHRATLLAKEAGAKLHIVHISSGRGVIVAAEAKARGCDVSVETCPHYLHFTEEDVERLGALAKCAPPLRDRCEQAGLWAHVMDGTVDIIASDHSPAPPEMKFVDFQRAWGGIAGVQSTLAVLLEGVRHRGLPLDRIASMLAAEPARRFRLKAKGRIEPGHDADFVLVDLNQPHTVTRDSLLQRHGLSPYLGHTFPATIRRTIRRGETIFDGAWITAQSNGCFIRPEQN
jgi:allantoinase